MRLVNKPLGHWDRMPRKVIDASPLETVKVRLGGALISLIWLEMSLLTAEQLD